MFVFSIICQFLLKFQCVYKLKKNVLFTLRYKVGFVNIFLANPGLFVAKGPPKNR